MLQAGPWTNNVEKIAFAFMLMAAFLFSVTTAIPIILLIAAIIIYWLAGNWIVKGTILIRNCNSTFVGVIFLLFLIGLTYTSATRHDALFVMIRYGKLFFLPFLLPMFANEKHQKLALQVFVAGIVFLVLMSFLNIFHVTHIHLSYDPGTAFHNHIQTSLEVTLGIFILAHWMMDNTKIYWRILYFGLILIFIVYLFGFNTGRSGLVLLAPLAAIFLFQRFVFKLAVPWFLVIILSGFAAYHFVPNLHREVSALVNNTIHYLVNDKQATQLSNTVQQTSEAYRLSFWKNSIKIVLQRPVFGHGTGSFNQLYTSVKNQPYTNNPYNELLSFGVQFGLVGIGVLLSWCGYLIYQSFNLPREIKYIALGIVVAYAFGCLYNSWLMDGMPGYIFVLLIGILYARERAS